MTHTVQAQVLFSRRACAARRAAILVAAILACSPARAGLDEFRIKREAVYAFVRTPQVIQEGDRVQIRFETKGFCDVTIAIEEAVPEGVRNPPRVPDTLSDSLVSGRIIRHLACGVLGPNAPAPFERNSKSQTLVWDGKDDKGEYVDDRAGLTVRVSLGLKARFERTLYWEPKRRIARERPLIQAAPEGVYVYEGKGFDHLRLFDHEGNYVRTVYPFPADKIDACVGLARHAFPQDGKRLAVKVNFNQSTMLTSGTNSMEPTYQDGRYRSVVSPAGYGNSMRGLAATVMAVRGDRIALAHLFLNRLATDGTTGGLDLTGPRTTVSIVGRGYNNRRKLVPVPPRSAALSPDGKWLYLAGLQYGHQYRASADIVGVQYWDSLPGVLRLNMDKEDEPELFAGSAKFGESGTDDAHFKVPTSVACDPQGRVYVTDYVNDRIQVFAPDGTHLKTIRTKQPAHVVVHQRTGDIHVFTWRIASEYEVDFAPPRLRHLGPFDAPREIASYPLPGVTNARGRYVVSGFPYLAEVDSWADGLTVWLVKDWALSNVLTRKRMSSASIVMLVEKDGQLRVKRDFSREAGRRIRKLKPPANYRQRLYVNPKTGVLYVSESDAGVGKSFKDLIAIDPDTGRARLVDLPFDAEDMAFGPAGLAYLRTASKVVRYDPETWREIPFDYGEEHERIGFSSSSDGRRASVTSAIMLPSNAFWHHGGMGVSPRGRLAVSCYYDQDFETRAAAPKTFGGKAYAPTLYPGRMPSSGRGGAIIHVFDERGRAVHRDAVPGLGDIYGLEIDHRDDLYLMSGATRILDGTPHFNDLSGTMMKFRPGRGKVLTLSKRIPVPLPEGTRPNRPADVTSAPQGTAWVEGAEWMYGGVGWDGKNRGVGCACWNARFVLDYFARSFAPEVDRYSVAVLDASGNLILRVGQYGNADDGRPLITAGGPPNPRSIGGDEVALFHGAYVGVHTDRRLFIADPGNARIVSVKLDYHATEVKRVDGG